MIADDLVSCDFESAATENSICRVRQDTRDNFDWSFTQGRTPSGANYERRINDLRVPVTGPDGAHQGSYYSYIEASGRTTGLSAGWVVNQPSQVWSKYDCIHFLSYHYDHNDTWLMSGYLFCYGYYKIDFALKYGNFRQIYESIDIMFGGQGY